jgi:hypothetical protein
VSDAWEGWPPDWPKNEKYLTGTQTCRRCGRQLQYTLGRVTPSAWMHRECALDLAAEYRSSLPAVHVLTELDDEDLEP